MIITLDTFQFEAIECPQQISESFDKLSNALEL